MKIVLVFFSLAILIASAFIVFSNISLAPLSLPNEEAAEIALGEIFMIGFEGTVLTPEFKKIFEEIRPGGVLILARNVVSREQFSTLTRDLQNLNARVNKYPLFIASDEEGGTITRIPFLKEQTPPSKMNSREVAFSIGADRARELYGLGVNLNLAPVLDSGRAGDFIFNRTFQKDPSRSALYARSFIEGMKSEKVFSTVKHFPGYGGITYNPERDKLPRIDTVPDTSQFKLTLDARPAFVMTSNVIYDEISSEPFGLSPKGVSLVRERLGNEILIMTDDLSSPVLKGGYGLSKTVEKAIEAGSDMMIVAGFDDKQDPLTAYYAARDLVNTNKSAREIAKRAIMRVQSLKQSLFLQEN